LFLSLLINWPHFVFAQESPQNPFIAVFVDDATEKALGPFPYDRSKYAEVISTLREAKAKAVVLKYFLDQAKPGGGDDELSVEIKKLPVLLQARFDQSEPHPNSLPVSFGCGSRVRGDTSALLSGQSGWIPLEKFSQGCVGIGFVDIASKNDVLNIPMVIKYRGCVLPSLELAALELALGQPASIFLGDKISFASHSLRVNASGQIHVQLPAKDQIDSISFVDVIKGNFDKKRVAGKIVILGFDAKETPVLATSMGPLRVHRLFYYSLESLYEQLEAD
jgi:hypothetical protein